jgi:glyceraldehyde-3-phosphate dehydrogenase/erythrose-4-phosphate dehydrogenase
VSNVRGTAAYVWNGSFLARDHANAAHLLDAKKPVARYDNDWGYSEKLLDLVRMAT